MVVNNCPCISTNLDLNVGKDDRVYLFHKITKKSYVIGKEEYSLLLKADGTKNYEELSAISRCYSKEDIERLFIKFEELHFVNDNEKNYKDGKKRFQKKIGLINGNRLISEDAVWNRILAFALKYLSIPLFATSLIGLLLSGRLNEEMMNGIQEFRSILWMLPMIWISVSLHELGHASIARSYKMNVPEIGIMIYIFMPYAYTNLSYIATLSKKRQRLCVLFAGMLMNFLLAGIAFGTAFFIKPEISKYFVLYGVSNITLIITNLLIFFKLDGYFIFQEMIGEENLREKSIASVKNTFVTAMNRIINRQPYILQYEKTDTEPADKIFYFSFGILVVSYIPVILVSWVVNIISYFV